MLLIDDTSAADQDEAVVNFRYVDTNGSAGSLIEVVRKLPGSATATHATDWWMFGNQQVVDSVVRSFIRRNEQLAPAPNPPFANASLSRYETGIEMFINKTGPAVPDCVRRASLARGCRRPASFSRGRTRRSSPTRPGSISAARTVLPIPRRPRWPMTWATSFACSAPRVWPVPRLLPSSLNPTRATAATRRSRTGHIRWISVRQSARHRLTTSFSRRWWPIETTRSSFITMANCCRATLPKTALTPIVPATFAVNLRWHTLTPATLVTWTRQDRWRPADHRPAGWTPDPLRGRAPARVLQLRWGLSVSDSLIDVPRGATSATAVAPAGTPFRALTSDGTTSRSILLRYRTLDGSYKDSFTRYN